MLLREGGFRFDVAVGLMVWFEWEWGEAEGGWKGIGSKESGVFSRRDGPPTIATDFLMVGGLPRGVWYIGLMLFVVVVVAVGYLKFALANQEYVREINQPSNHPEERETPVETAASMEFCL